MGNVVAMVLVQVTALLGQVHRLPGADVFQINDRVGDSILRSNDEALQANFLLAIGIADLRILGDRKLKLARYWARPFHGPRDRSTVGNGNDFVVLRRREAYKREQ